MKTIFYLMLAAFIVAADLSVAETQHSHDENLVKDVKRMEEAYRPWLPDKPNERRISFLDPETLPEAIRKLGFRCATIEDGFVILISSGEDADIVEGVAISTDGKDPSKLLKDLGWEASGSDDPRIKNLKQKRAQQDAPSNGG